MTKGELLDILLLVLLVLAGLLMTAAERPADNQVIEEVR